MFYYVLFIDVTAVEVYLAFRSLAQARKAGGWWGWRPWQQRTRTAMKLKGMNKMHTKRFLSLTLRTLWLFLLPLGRSQLKSYFAGLVDGALMDEEDDDDEWKRDSAEMLLHEFVYKLKNYFMESERALRVPGLLIFLFLRILSHND